MHISACVIAFSPSSLSRGELLTRLAIWLALLAYAVAVPMLLLARKNPAVLPRARWVWTLGCGFFCAHVALAFGTYHGWSHDAAYRDTARQTAELTGMNWGGGLYFNYVFAAAWLADAAWWWTAPASFWQRPRSITAMWHGFALFMIINGTIVFGHGPVRVLGILICATLAAVGWWSRRTQPPAPSPSP